MARTNPYSARIKMDFHVEDQMEQLAQEKMEQLVADLNPEAFGRSQYRLKSKLILN